MAQKIDKEILIGELINVDVNIVPILMSAGMHCVGCPSSQMESLDEACMVHGIDSDMMVDAINEYLAAKDM
ncbi:MAG: DUF1858 domain-containing protein [Lachnospiraceae bacterium]|nr:DUF1858 domain-containing protein [Lachnospiraceae bacterium]